MISSGMDTSSSSSELQDHIEATPSLRPGLELEDPQKSAIILEADDDVSPPNFTYTSCFCEENVYMLCKTLSQVGFAAADASDLFVVFISNGNQQIPIWRQKNSKDATGLCIWDYHVICIQRDLKREEAAQVWDLDTTLPCPVMLDVYATEALRPWVALRSEFTRLYRIVAAPVFLRSFASDRRHMKRSDGTWIALPPQYDCLVGEDGSVHNLGEFLKISEDKVLLKLGLAESLLKHERFGIVLSEGDLLRFFN